MTKKKASKPKAKKKPAKAKKPAVIHVADAPAEDAREVGRPTTYRPEFTGQAYKLALLGATDKEQADFFGCSESTFHLWKLAFPEFSESINAGKMIADAQVAEGLYDRARGATWIEDFASKVKTVEYENGKKVRETEKLEKIPVRKSAPPDTTAASLWLRNRRSGKSFNGEWRDKVDHQLSGPNGGPIEITDAKAALLRGIVQDTAGGGADTQDQ